MDFVRSVKSKDGVVEKYLFKTDDNLILEFSYINKEDGKYIICVPSQTMCKYGCKFCHTTEFIGKIPVRTVTFREYVLGLRKVIADQDLTKGILISFMGAGEPLTNVNTIVQIMCHYATEYKDMRFGLATMISHMLRMEFFTLADKIRHFDLPVKLHLSLHYTEDNIRAEWMPAALSIKPSMTAVRFYAEWTGQPVEIHYALIDEVNDTEKDAERLAYLLSKVRFAVKFLFYNEKEGVEHKKSNLDKFDMFREVLSDSYIVSEYKIPDGSDISSSCGQFIRDVEYYVPPGLDIGASCGQFNLEFNN